MPKASLILTMALLGAPGALAEGLSGPGNTVVARGDRGLLGQSLGMVMLDYEKIDLASGGKFDLLQVHYLHQVNDWLYLGAGIGAPMVEGDYGGFFTLNANVHVQKQVYGNWFVDAGLAFGAGAGGKSVQQIKALSGSGGYFKKYAGVGYRFAHFNLGVNYSDMTISNSPINGRALNIFFQKPLSFSAGSYSDAGAKLGPKDIANLGKESILSFEYSNLTQINPTGSYGGRIGLISPQFSHFLDDRYFWFFEADLGYSGLIWYNQAQGGIGRKFALAPRLNLYGQIGVGSGGWVTDTINTGSGVVIYPKVKLEYMIGKDVGTFLSAGYLFAPTGTSKNWSVGAGISYHLPSAKQLADRGSNGQGMALRGIRINLIERRVFDVQFNGQKFNAMDLTAIQFDYDLGRHWYLPFQVAAATNDFRQSNLAPGTKGYAGYVEGFVGIGWRSAYFVSNRMNLYAQLLYGMNDLGIEAKYDAGALLYPSFGFTYNISDRYSIYGQVGKAISVGHYLRPNITSTFSEVSIGLGVTYRFSLPGRAAR